MKFIKDFVTFLNEGVRLIDPPRKDQAGKTIYPGLVKIRFENDPTNPNEIKTLPKGEIKPSSKSKIRVIYALESEDGSSRNRRIIKNTMDALKNGGLLSTDMDEFEKIISSVIRNQVGSFENIGAIIKVGSRSPLVELLGAIIYRKNPKVAIARLQKKKYESVEQALNLEVIASLADTDPRGTSKKKLDAYRSARRDENPFFITKSGDMPSSLRKFFLDKYDFSKTMEKKPNALTQFGAPYETTSFSEVCVKTLYNVQEGKVTLIVDDNIHSGDDMTEIVEGMKKVAKNWINTITESTESSIGEMSDLEKKKYEEQVKKNQETLEKYKKIYDSSLNLMSRSLMGLVAYKIKDDDVPKKNEKDESDMSQKLPVGIEPFEKQPAGQSQKKKKIKRVTPKTVIKIFKEFEILESGTGKDKERSIASAFHKTLDAIEINKNDLKLRIEEEERERAGTRKRTRGLSVSEFVNTNAKLVNDELARREKELRIKLKKNVIVPRVNPEIHIKEIMKNRSFDSSLFN